MIIVVTGAASGCKAMDGGGRVKPNIVFPSLPRTCRTLQRALKPKVETIHVLLLLLTIFTARASASLTFLKFFDQSREPIDKAGDISRILLSTKTLYLQATNFASLDGTIVAENLTQFTICSSIYVGFFRKNFYF